MSLPVHLCSGLLLIFCSLRIQATAASYANVTLTSLNGDLQVTVYLPEGIDSGENPTDFFYRSTRFEHGSMIGAIRRISPASLPNSPSSSSHLPSNTAAPLTGTGTGTNTTSSNTNIQHTHTLYGSDMWRVPHDPMWPESGLGLASEFGIGDDGSFCDFRCGWHGVDNVTNGVLGYRTAKPGDPFLKIGVGKLIKGSCRQCDSTDDYKFNSPYVFASLPKWNFSQPVLNTIVLEHQETLNQHGYKLRKEISLVDNVLLVKSTLTNIGSDAFSTAWYSHHFFSCDKKPIGPGYSVELGLKPTNDLYTLYEEPDTLSWSTPLQNYARVMSTGETVLIEMQREIERGIRVKAYFNQDLSTKGTFTLRACGTSIVEDIAEFVEEPYDPISMYGFNLYLEKGTISPEPQIFIHLEPGQSKAWTQRLAITETLDPGIPVSKVTTTQSYLQSVAAYTFSSQSINHGQHRVAGTFFLVTVCLSVLILNRRSNGRRLVYTPIPEADV